MSPDYDLILVHHAALDGSDDHLDTDDIRWMHTRENGWRDIGYSAVIEKVDGVPIAVFGRPWYQTPAHARGYNSHALGVCFVGNFEEHDIDSALLEEGAKAIASIMAVTGIRRLGRHRDVAATLCPGSRFPFERLVARVEALLGEPVRTLK